MKKNLNIKHPILKKIVSELRLNNLKELASHCKISYTTIHSWERLGVISDIERLQASLPELDPSFFKLPKEYELNENIEPMIVSESGASYQLKKIDIIYSIVTALGLTSITELAKKINLSPTTLNNWSKINRMIDVAKLTKALPEINPNFIKSGTGQPLLEIQLQLDELESKKKEVEELNRRLHTVEEDIVKAKEQIGELKFMLSTQKDIIHSLEKTTDNPIRT